MMTEKRFTMNEDGYIWDNKEPISQETVLIRLNALHEENEQLKKELESFKPIIFESDGKPVTLYKKGDAE